MALVKFTVTGPDNITGLFAYESSAAVPVTGTYESDKSPWIYIAPPGNTTQIIYFLGAEFTGYSEHLPGPGIPSGPSIWHSRTICAQKNYFGSATNQGFFPGPFEPLWTTGSIAGCTSPNAGCVPPGSISNGLGFPLSSSYGFHASASCISSDSNTILLPNDIIFIPRYLTQGRAPVVSFPQLRFDYPFQRLPQHDGRSGIPNFSIYSNTASNFRGPREFFSLDKLNSGILEMLPVTIVSSLPTATSLRPSAFGNPENRMTSSLDVSRVVPSNPMLSYLFYSFNFYNPLYYSVSGSVGKTRPTYKELNGAFSRFSIPMVPNNSPQNWELFSIIWQSQGMSLPRIVSDAFIRLMDPEYNSNGAIPLETILDRDKLILRMTQMGVDLWSLYKSGKKSPWNPLWLGTVKNQSFAGLRSPPDIDQLEPENCLFTDINSQALVNSGHKALIMFAGIVLDNQEMMDPDATFLSLGDISGTTAKARIFPENGFYYEADSDASGLSATWIGGKYAFQHTAVSSIMVASGAGTASAMTCNPGLRSYQSLAPTSVAGSGLWANTTLNPTFAPADALELEGVVAGANLGTSIFMQCAKLAKQWSKTAVGGIRLYFLLPPNNIQSMRYPIFGIDAPDAKGLIASSFTGYARNIYGASSVNEDYVSPLLSGALYYNPKFVVGARTNFSNLTLSSVIRQTNRGAIFSSTLPRLGNYGLYQYFRAGEGYLSFLNSNHFELDSRLFGNGINNVMPPNIKLGTAKLVVANGSTGSNSSIDVSAVPRSMMGGLLFTEDSIKWGKIRFQLIDAPTINATSQNTSGVFVLGRSGNPRPYIWSGSVFPTTDLSGTGGGLSSINGYSYVSKLAPYASLEKTFTVNKYGNYIIEIDLSAFDPDLATIGTPYFIPPGFENIAVQVFWPTTGYVSNALFMTVDNLN